MALSQMMQHYLSMKEKYKDCVVFYRLGDFYEMFFEDAVKVSKLLDLTLTGRDCGLEERAPMCGIPYHAADTYIAKLVECGEKVAICDQLSDPKASKGLVERDVVRVVSAGTLIEDEMLDESKNNYIACVFKWSDGVSIAWTDITTGEFLAEEFVGETSLEDAVGHLVKLSVAEVICNEEMLLASKNVKEVKHNLLPAFSCYLPWAFNVKHAEKNLLEQFNTTSLAAFGIAAKENIIAAAGALVEYLRETQKHALANINAIKVVNLDKCMTLDSTAVRNLELVRNNSENKKYGSLLWVLDKTKTGMGARMLTGMILSPLKDEREINYRLDGVEEFVNSSLVRVGIAETLKEVKDVERLSGKISNGNLMPKDCVALAASLSVLPSLKFQLTGLQSQAVEDILAGLPDMKEIADLLTAAIDPTPPALMKDGGYIRTGFHEELDEYRALQENGATVLKGIEERERERTGIRTLKIGNNRVFGYYIEVTKSLIDQVPDRYIRKQTLSNCERYITQDLKDVEATILGAADKVCTLEYNLFQEIRQRIADESERIRKTANLVATVDVYNSLAAVAAKNNYIKPEIDDSNIIDIKDGRHPVVEQFVKDTYFVPNDIYLDTSANRLMLITGPNMAGKSTYMRQVALIVVMAQIGSYVPATDARIGIVDKVFTRVGASDDLASGQSTFMLEMNEVAYILRNATQKSLIIYDEVGRGTSTFDGMSIARAIIEYTNGKKIGAKTLFATHYHELTSMEDEFSGIVNYNIAAKKRGDDIIFLRKIIRGSTDDSYGIEVAKLAGLPNEVIKRAKEILATVEKTSRTLTTSNSNVVEEMESLITFEEITEKSVIEDIKKIDINSMTPVEAMNLLFELNNRLK